MKYLSTLAIGCLLAFGTPVMAGPSEADTKWLEAVQKMVAKGDLKVSTPKEERVEILKKWAKKEGWAAKVTKIDAGFRIELSKAADAKIANN